jgi:hypothetical protein
MAELFWGTVVPILAVCMSNIQAVPPLNAAVLCRKARNMGALDATPWAMGFVNCCGLLIYGCMLGDLYIMCSVGPGIFVFFYAFTSAAALLGAQGKFKAVGKVIHIHTYINTLLLYYYYAVDKVICYI